MTGPAQSRVGAAGRIERPVIILGAPRSGTSLLATLLAAHPDVLLLREPRLVWRYGNDRRSDQLRPQHARPEVVEHIHGSFAAQLAESGASRIVEKTPANTVRPLFIDAVFPDALYVHITRDGWAAVPSIRNFSAKRGTGMDGRQVRKVGRRFREAELRQIAHYVPELARRVSGRIVPGPSLYGPRLAGHRRVASELGDLETAALQWRTCVDSAAVFGRSLPADRYLEVQLETLDENTLRLVLDFAGLRVADEVLEAFRSSYRAEEGQRKSALSAAEAALVAPYVLPANEWLGYRPAAAAASAGAASAGVSP